MKLPEGITFERVSFKQGYPTRRFPKLWTYAVYQSGVLIGHVEANVRQTYKKHGRIRYDTGWAKGWVPKAAPGYPAIRYAYSLPRDTRVHAARDLVEHMRDHGKE